ncbi:Uncharacterised protein g1571 [Pycnogonum litorale]
MLKSGGIFWLCQGHLRFVTYITVLSCVIVFLLCDFQEVSCAPRGGGGGGRGGGGGGGRGGVNSRAGGRSGAFRGRSGGMYYGGRDDTTMASRQKRSDESSEQNKNAGVGTTVGIIIGGILLAMFFYIGYRLLAYFC